MRHVQNTTRAPGFCLATGRPKDAEGFIDCGMTPNYAFPHSYISVGAVREMAALVGLVSAEEVTQAQEEAEALRQRVAELEAEVERFKEFEENARYTLRWFEHDVKKRPGPKVKA